MLFFILAINIFVHKELPVLGQLSYCKCIAYIICSCYQLTINLVFSTDIEESFRVGLPDHFLNTADHLNGSSWG